MFKYKYIFSILTKNRFSNKILFNMHYNINDIQYFNKIEIIFKLSSNIENKQRFIIMLMLLEKYLNNKLIFLLDNRTFSTSRVLKIGCIIYLKKEMLLYYLNLCNMHSSPKFYENKIIFELRKSNNIFNVVEKILFNTIFNMDKDITLFYDYLNEFNYVIQIVFRTNFNNIYFNQLLLSVYGINISTNKDNQFINLIHNSWFDVLANVLDYELEENIGLLNDLKKWDEYIIEKEYNYIIINNLIDNNILLNIELDTDEFLLLYIINNDILINSFDFLTEIK